MAPKAEKKPAEEKNTAIAEKDPAEKKPKADKKKGGEEGCRRRERLPRRSPQRRRRPLLETRRRRRDTRRASTYKIYIFKVGCGWELEATGRGSKELNSRLRQRHRYTYAGESGALTMEVGAFKDSMDEQSI
ncbi:hypothetical protein SOVF_029900 [Spinacia oleracea]|nr:hypothetical protein SOVF_029900 [Spinacia oleracea]